MESDFISGWNGGNWEYSLSYEEGFEWNVQGIWAAGAEEITSALHGGAIEIDIQSVNQDEEYVELSAKVYRTHLYDDYSVDKTENIEVSIVVDYTGMDYLATSKLALDEEEQEELKYQEPTLSFEFYVGQDECIVRIEPYDTYFEVSGYDGRFFGNLYKGYTINTHLERVSK